MNEQKVGSSAGGNQVTYRRYDAGDARQLRDVVEAIYVRSYVEAIASGDPFDSVEAFMNRFDSYAANPNLDLVVAYQGGEARAGMGMATRRAREMVGRITKRTTRSGFHS